MRMPQLLYKPRAILALLLVLINAYVLSIPVISNAINSLGGFGGATIGTYIVAFVSTYLGLTIAKLISNWGKISVSA